MISRSTDKLVVRGGSEVQAGRESVNGATKICFLRSVRQALGAIPAVSADGGLALALLLTVLVLVIFSGPQLPALGLPAVAPVVSADDLRGIIRGEHVAKNIPYRDRKASKIQYVRSPSPVLHPRPAARRSEGAPAGVGASSSTGIPAASFRCGCTSAASPTWFPNG